MCSGLGWELVEAGMGALVVRCYCGYGDLSQPTIHHVRIALALFTSYLAEAPLFSQAERQLTNNRLQYVEA